MNIRELVFRDDTSGAVRLYACGKCGNCYSPHIVGIPNAIDMAEKCCLPEHHACNMCGADVEKYRNLCSDCTDLVRLRKAARIAEEDWTDPVHLDGVSGGWGEGFFGSVDELHDVCADNAWVEFGPQLPPPAYCWPCKPQHLHLDVDRLLEQAVDDMHEDAADEIVDADGLAAFIEAWNAKQTCVSWYPDHSRVVVLDPVRFEEMLNAR